MSRKQLWRLWSKQSKNYHRYNRMLFLVSSHAFMLLLSRAVRCFPVLHFPDSPWWHLKISELSRQKSPDSTQLANTCLIHLAKAGSTSSGLIIWAPRNVFLTGNHTIFRVKYFKMFKSPICVSCQLFLGPIGSKLRREICRDFQKLWLSI